MLHLRGSQEVGDRPRSIGGGGHGDQDRSHPEVLELGRDAQPVFQMTASDDPHRQRFRPFRLRLGQAAGERLRDAFGAAEGLDRLASWLRADMQQAGAPEAAGRLARA